VIEKYGEFVGKGSFFCRIGFVFVVTAAAIVPRRGEFTAKHAVKPDQDEGDGKQLALIDANQALHVEFPGLLHLFEELYAETEDENKGKAEAEEKAEKAFAVLSVLIHEIPILMMPFRRPFGGR